MTTRVSWREPYRQRTHGVLIRRDGDYFICRSAGVSYRVNKRDLTYESRV